MANIEFDTTKTANWYTGIAMALLNREIDWAPIEALERRTLAAMGILTRGAPRERMVKQIRKAIKDLIRNGVLTEYTPGRVRILDKARIRKYATKAIPIKTTDKKVDRSDASNDGASSTRELFEDPDTDSESMDKDLFLSSAEKRQFLLPSIPLSPSSYEQLGKTEDLSADPEGHTLDEASALDTLLGESQLSELSHASSNSLSSEEPKILNIRLESILSKLLQGGATDVSCTDRQLTSNFGNFSLKIDQRRDGSIRAVMSFPESMLAEVLKSVRRQWHRAVVGTSDMGAPAILYFWERTPEAEQVAQIILGDVVFLEDCLSA